GCQPRRLRHHGQAARDHRVGVTKTMSTPRPWVVFSSSTGQTFRAFHAGLDAESRAGLKGFFTDRPCVAAEIARQTVDEAPVYELDRASFESFVLEWIEKKNLRDGVILLCGFFGILSKEFLGRCPLPIVNTHPSLL